LTARGGAGAAAGVAADAAAGHWVTVWDPLVRAFHWSVAAACLAELFVLDSGRWVHRWVGYYVWAAVAVRVAWGFVGPAHARFGDFVPSPSGLLAYVKAARRGEEPRHLGHNPLGALMILFMLALLFAICLTGWMQKTDRFFGVGWVEDTHAALSDVLIAAMLVHVAGAILASVRHRENLVWAMVTGRKRAAP
jgi:cytochrome b